LQISGSSNDGILFRYRRRFLEVSFSGAVSFPSPDISLVGCFLSLLSEALLLISVLFFARMGSVPAIMDMEHFSPYRADGKLVSPEEVLAECKAD
jgi:hypothetical protein